jgi:hypothetical protein
MMTNAMSDDLITCSHHEDTKPTKISLRFLVGFVLRDKRRGFPATTRRTS